MGRRLSPTQMLGMVALYSALLAVLFFVHVQLMNYCCDDAYIHFRIAKHLAIHGVPYYNLNEPVMASSSPAWTMAVAAVMRFVGDVPLCVAYLNAALSAGVAFLAAIIICHSCVGRSLEASVGNNRRLLARNLDPGHRQLREFWCHLLSVALILPLIMDSSLILMETPLALVALLLGAYLLAVGRNVGFGFLTIASFTRPELSLFLVCYMAERAVRRKLDLPSLAWVIGPAFLFCAYNIYFYQSIMLHTAQAKRLVYDISFRQSAWWVLNGFFSSSGESGFFQALRFLLVFAVMASLASLLFRNYRAAADIVCLWLLPSLGVALFYLGWRVYMFSWYIPLYSVPFMIACLMVGFRMRSRLLVVLLLVASIPGFISVGRTLYASTGHYEVYKGFAEGGRVRQYLEVGKELFAKYPSYRLMTSEIGGLGYGFEGTVLDGAGLVSPDALRYHPMKIPEERSSGAVGAIPVGYVEEIKPELIVSLDLFARHLLDSAVIRDYERTRRNIYVESDMARAPAKSLWGSHNLNVFIRRDAVRSDPSMLQR